MTKIRVGVLGSSGSIGRQTLDVIREHSDLFEVSLLLAKNSKSVLEAQIAEFLPDVAVCGDTIYRNGTEANCAPDILNYPEFYEKSDVVVNGIGGLAGLLPSIAVLQSSAELATANKESIVSAGSFLMETAKKHNKLIRPVDSEHSALWRCIDESSEGESLVLTASGGAFRDFSREELCSATAKMALNHPTWKMGKKVTIDSATLMNKGLEIIEARHLFGINDIDVVIHRESIVHALVGSRDGSFKASLSSPDMRLPIQYALTYPNSLASATPKLSLKDMGALHFEAPDLNRFPCLKLGLEVAAKPQLGVVLVAADDVAVEAFLQDKISFYGVSDVIESALNKFSFADCKDLNDIFSIDRAVREYTLTAIENGGK
ncbi:MAG: 1-deoxy-D-xylulose-5-phosphate reductoisomerase [Bacillota bacterium]